MAFEYTIQRMYASRNPDVEYNNNKTKYTYVAFEYTIQRMYASSLHNADTNLQNDVPDLILTQP